MSDESVDCGPRSPFSCIRHALSGSTPAWNSNRTEAGPFAVGQRRAARGAAGPECDAPDHAAEAAVEVGADVLGVHPGARREVELVAPSGREGAARGVFDTWPQSHSGGGCSGQLCISRPRNAAVSLMNVAGKKTRLPAIMSTTKRGSNTERGAASERGADSGAEGVRERPYPCHRPGNRYNGDPLAGSNRLDHSDPNTGFPTSPLAGP